jgi:putative transposase
MMGGEQSGSPDRVQLGHEFPQWVADDAVFFITICCAERGRRQLTLPEVGPWVLDAARHYDGVGKWCCGLMLLMPDHLHALIHFPRIPGLKTTVSDWKRYLARTRKIEWQRDFFDHRLRSEQRVEEVAAYIMLNPVRRGLIQCADDWRWVYRCRGTPRTEPPAT